MRLSGIVAWVCSALKVSSLVVAICSAALLTDGRQANADIIVVSTTGTTFGGSDSGILGINGTLGSGRTFTLTQKFDTQDIVFLSGSLPTFQGASFSRTEMSLVVSGIVVPLGVFNIDSDSDSATLQLVNDRTPTQHGINNFDSISAGLVAANSSYSAYISQGATSYWNDFVPNADFEHSFSYTLDLPIDSADVNVNVANRGFQTLFLNGDPISISVTVTDVPVAPVPEPSTWAMMLLGFLGVGFMAYRRRKTAALAP